MREIFEFLSWRWSRDSGDLVEQAQLKKSRRLQNLLHDFDFEAKIEAQIFYNSLSLNSLGVVVNNNLLISGRNKNEMVETITF